MIYTDTYTSSLGNITLTATETALTGLWFEDEKYYGKVFAKMTPCPCKDHPVLARTREWLDAYFCGRNPDFTPPLLLEGTPFRLAVWEILKTISYGQTMTYGEIARIIAAQRKIPRMSAQAVGGAVGHNPISIIVPCHRVIGTDGSLTGYAGGLDRKTALLQLEGISINKSAIKPHPNR
ncbi:MAG: methylated-DNA--[protein]-cysteine S-methyltransferase [Lachnospiraceae bacterium]|nr:methylated-DNA--[protein]-cysteine S-methyltransferase [Lachnospiraceae bacterium]